MPLSIPACVVLALVLGLTACSTIESRIREKPGVFSALDASTQERVKTGGIDLGDSTEVVFIALGKPNETNSVQTERGTEVAWSYLDFRHEFAGRVFAGHQVYRVTDPKTGKSFVVSRPVWEDVYRTDVQERLRVLFSQGRVSAIEREKHKR